MKVLVVSPYHGGSHAAWGEGLQRFSGHDLRLLTLPARFWKWRMHGGAVTLARRFLATGWRPGVILATDMLDLTTFLALTRRVTWHVPTVLYMHENQLTYPLPADGRTGPMRRQHGERDLHYVFVNFVSMLAADRVLFNSRYHMDGFLEAVPRFLRHFPEYNELQSVDALREKCGVLPVGVDFGRLALGDGKRPFPATDPPLILWNQRWEYDKNPEAFFRVLFLLADEGYSFQVALCGQQYGKRPSIFTTAIEKLGDRIIHVGHADLPTYRHLLWRATVTISTAHHEFFGISILEAIYCHTFPLLPNRLSYPELIPESFHKLCLYEDEAALMMKLRQILSDPTQGTAVARQLASEIGRYHWANIAPQYDALFTELTHYPKHSAHSPN
ncbi:MAG: DUF3524 domain-containing protein [Chloroflexi bacterium]|nr:MAG: DUF3524 domain-containing protein [Chloroflexota bacterium]